MTVYVESNFVLEIALGQIEASAAERILDSAQRGELALLIPSFALFEPVITVRDRRSRRNSLMNQMNREMRELKRSQPHEEDVLGIEPIADRFTAIDERENRRLISTVQRMFDVAEVIEIVPEVYGEAIRLAQDFGLKLQDAIIGAAVLRHLQLSRTPGPHYFATRDVSDFSDPAIVARFADFECLIVPSFEECARRLRLGS